MDIQRKRFLDNVIERDFKKPFMLTFDYYGIDKVEEIEYMFDKVYGKGNYSFTHGEDYFFPGGRISKIKIHSVDHKDGGYLEILNGNGRGNSYLTNGKIIEYKLYNHKLKYKWKYKEKGFWIRL